MRTRNNINEFLGTQRMLESMSHALQAAQISSTLAASIPTNLINQQITYMAHPMRETIERWNQIFNSAGMIDLTRAASRLSELLKTPAIIEANQTIQDMLNNASLQRNFNNTLSQLNIGIDPQIFKTVQGLAIDTSGLMEAIQNNIGLFRGLDWSTIVDYEDLADLDIENALDGAVVDINDGISFQQQMVEFINKLKSKYPLLFIIFYMLVASPIQSAIDDAILGAIKGATTPIVKQVEADSKVIEKNIKIVVNNTLNINIESQDTRAEILKVYGYVSTKSLIMRQSNKIKSRALYTLEFGQVIKIIHKDRNWTLVEYQTEEDVIRGWVFTRYVSKFKN